SAKCPKPPPPVVLGDEWEFATDRPNVLPLAEWDYRIEASVWGRDAAGQAHVYSTTVKSEIQPAEARICLDGLAIERVWRGSAPVDFRLFVNDHHVTDFRPGEYLDHYIYEASIAGLVQPGRNRIRIETMGHLYETPNLAHPMLLVGRFALAQKRRRLVLTDEPGRIAGPWDRAGYPFYSGVATYCQSIRLTRRHLSHRLFLEFDAVGDLADVSVNGRPAGVRCWEPFSVDVTRHVRLGANEIIVRVANSLQNTLCGTPKPSGILGPARIVPVAKVRFRR
ncbi:MAG: glycosylhydrolase-like jelly roll fold domain-containing protein, partial [Armatimonadota bacterium]